MKNKTGFLVFSPFALAVSSAHFRSLWLVLATVILMFALVAVLPFTHKRESLWLFVLWAVCSIPVNLFLLREYPQWESFVISSENVFVHVLSTIEMLLVCTGVEEIFIGLVGRRIWRRQYVLMLPEIEED